jgi:hypothetical protein
MRNIGIKSSVAATSGVYDTSSLLKEQDSGDTTVGILVDWQAE